MEKEPTRSAILEKAGLPLQFKLPGHLTTRFEVVQQVVDIAAQIVSEEPTTALQTLNKIDKVNQITDVTSPDKILKNVEKTIEKNKDLLLLEAVHTDAEKLSAQLPDLAEKLLAASSVLLTFTQFMKTVAVICPHCITVAGSAFKGMAGVSGSGSGSGLFGRGRKKGHYHSDGSYHEGSHDEPYVPNPITTPFKWLMTDQAA